MATNPNSRAAKGDLERAEMESKQCDFGPTTGLVRGITFKILPLCSFLLIIFSAGVILISKFSFNKPLPHQAALIISIILLIFFVLFSFGWLHLHYRKSLSHASDRWNPTGPPRHNSDDGLGGNLIRTDTLQGQAPSPSEYRKSIQEQENIARSQEMVHELRDPSHHAVQHNQQYSNGSAQIPPSSPARLGYSEAAISPNSILCNGVTNADSTSVPQCDQAYAYKDTQNPQKSPPVPVPGGDLAQPPPAAMIKMHHSIDPSHLCIPKTRQQVKGPRDMPRHNASSRNSDALKPPLPTPANSGGVGSQQPQTVQLAPQAINKLSKLPTRGGERQGPDHKREGPQSPGCRAKSLKMITLEGNKADAVRRRFSFELSSAKDSVNEDEILRATPREIPGFRPRHPSAVPEPLKLVSKKERVDMRQGEDERPATHDVMEMQPQPPPIAYEIPREEDVREESLQGGLGRRRPRIPRRSSSRKHQ
ncbi:hypothetical protein F5B22DRAFT_646759 [Xylaria bambusicola]|uniref:uncharacterized protein n=1 Tax=Xylaria bambusicola TaxID=326684 RepID=UPI0020073A96|nr:uncharacterized protein F5B22DRAFT_646759 [Xylaria bambusicola]KAI0515483.1 hypothetical protein F5B22DRAFT_646759 [Xylaria bambusicola]